MKKLLEITGLLFILSIQSSVLFAQTSDDVTKQDAVSFINKVYQNFPKKYTNQGYNLMYGYMSYDSQAFYVSNIFQPDSTIFSLKRCSLTINSYYTVTQDKTLSYVVIDKKKTLVRLIITAQIDLSSAQLEINSYSSFNGFKVNINSKFNLNTTFVYHYTKDNKTIAIETTKLSDPSFLSGDFPSIDLSDLVDEHISGYEEGKYNERLIKAFTFLVDKCGGGEVKPKLIDTGSKF